MNKLDQLSAELATLALAEPLARVLDRRRYRSYGASTDVQNLTNPEIVISGPAGTGKSRACLEKLHYFAQEYRGLRGLVIRKTRTSLTDTGLVTFERDVLGIDSPMVINGPQRRFRHSYKYPNGSEIVCGGMDKPGRILSGEYDIIFVQQAEELREDEWEILITRLRGTAAPYQQLLGDCNPEAPRHWIKQRASVGDMPLLESRHEENPLLWDGEDWTEFGAKYISKLDRLTGVRKERLRYGRWRQAEGAVYESFDRNLHLIDRKDIPDDWRRYRSIDFGHTDPFVCQWWAQDGDGRLYLYKEIYMTKRTVRDHALKIVALTKADEEVPEPEEGEEKRVVRGITATICDHDAEDRATLRQEGVSNVAANKSVLMGIDRVEERLRKAEDGKPRIFFMRDSLVETDQRLADAKRTIRTVDEFDSYVWENKKRKEQPAKDNDHGMDAVRYMVMHLDSGEPSGADLVSF